MNRTPPARPYRADQVGSYLRPEKLIEARRRRQNAELDAAGLRRIEDEHIRELVAMQEEVGLPCATDGEFRRQSWNSDFLAGFENVRRQAGNLQLFHRNPDGTDTSNQISAWAVTGRLRRAGPIQVEDFKFLRDVSHITPKTCMPSPTLLHFRGGRDAVDRVAYPDLGQFFDDVAAAYREEILDLYAAGARYIQLDDTNFAYLCDPRFREAVKQRGEDPVRMVDGYIDLINASVRDRPKDLLVAIHICRGNSTAGGAATGGYEVVGPQLFPKLEVDAFFLEYDSERAGGFGALADVPRSKFVVLGLVTTKRAELESRDELKRRIDSASRFLPLENLCLSPQCGFASGVQRANRMQIADEMAKMKLIVDTAREVWREL